MANKKRTLEITPGTPKFNKMVYRLTKPIDETVLQSMDYNGNHLQRIQPHVFVMPVYMKPKFNLFMVVARLVGHDWVAAFSTAKVRNHNEVTDLSDPFPTGLGLNMLGSRSPKNADRLLKYFNTLIEAKYGEWRLVK